VALLKQALKVAGLRVLLGALGAVLLLALTLFSIYRYKRVVSPPVSTLARAQAVPALALPTLPPEQTFPPVVYQSGGRRDPFRQPRVTVQKGPEVNLRVTGIVQGPRSYYALVESESPTGTGFVIRENDVVDSARVLKITKDSVIFEVETTSREGRPLTRRVQKHIGL
jgi:type II secretory pathway component PulC